LPSAASLTNGIMTAHAATKAASRGMSQIRALPDVMLAPSFR